MSPTKESARRTVPSRTAGGKRKDAETATDAAPATASRDAALSLNDAA